jgi:hypothetical protein
METPRSAVKFLFFVGLRKFVDHRVDGATVSESVLAFPTNKSPWQSTSREVFCVPPQGACRTVFCMNSRARLAGVISSMVLDCAIDKPFDTTETPQERAQRERQERTQRVNLGRIGELDRAKRTRLDPH